MKLLELFCLGIVALYVAMRRREPGFFVRFGTLSLASFMGEDSVIRAYGHYGYSAEWSVRIDHVPLVIVLVWPVVIDSARALAAHYAGPSTWRRAAFGALVVLADASLIEPIAVRAGLWRWTEPGLFGVPLVGIAGWAFFAFAALLVLDRKGLVLLVAPLATHAVLLLSWHLLFERLPRELSETSAVAVAWLFALPVAALARRAPKIAPRELWVRAPAALFFFVLLGLTRRAPWPFVPADPFSYVPPVDSIVVLSLYAAAFAPAYLAALARKPLTIEGLAKEKTAL